MPSDECGSNDEEALQDVDGATGEWLAVFHYPYRDDLNQTFSSGTNCHTVLDRVCTCALQSTAHCFCLLCFSKHSVCFTVTWTFTSRFFITFLARCHVLLGQEGNDVWCFCYYHTGAQSKNH